MTRIAPIAGALFAAAMLIALLVTAAPATASPPGASVVLDQPDGFTDPFTGAGAHNSLGAGRAVSADGRYVAFVSHSDGLASTDDDRVANVYRKDRATGEVVLVSAATNGPGANEGSYEPHISDDGNRIAFLSAATNLDPAATDTSTRLYVRDVAERRTILAGRATGAAGMPVDVVDPSLSGDGRVVAFSTDERLDPQDANAMFDVYARRLATDETVLVSRKDGANGALADRHMFEASVNRDGTKIAFISEGPLEASDANDFTDVYRRTLTTGVTDLISHNGSGQAGNGNSELPDISPSGDAVAFVSRASDLDGQVLDDANGRADVFVKVGDAVRQLSPVPSGHATLGSSQPSIAGDRGMLRVAFNTILAADPASTQIAVRTVASGDVEVASATQEGQPARDDSFQPTISADGRVVAFVTRAGGLGTASGGDFEDIVARDLPARRIDLVSAPATGPLLEDLSGVFVHQSAGQLSPDARFAAFSAEHDGLGLVDRGSHVFLRDARTGRTLLVDRADGPDGAASANAYHASASADGRIVAFTTRSRLVAGDASAASDVYVRDTVAGTTQLVSRTSVGTGGNGDSSQPVVSADGRRVAFTTYASDLGAGDADRDADVYVLDLVTGERLLASRGTDPANGGAYGPALNADGSIVAYTSVATNLDPADTDTSADVFVRDLAAGTTRLASRRTDGSKGTAVSSNAALSADGRLVAFQSEAALQDDTDARSDVYVRDMAAQRTTLVSRASGAAGAKGNDRSDLPTISADGTAVSFRSYAANLGGEYGSVYVRRLDAGTTTAMGRGRPAGLSADGSCLMMATDSAALVRSSPDHERVLLRAVRERCELPEPPVGTPPGPPQPGPTGPVAQGGAPRLSALSLTRRRFRVGRARAAATGAVRRGTVVRFRLDRRAAVSLAIRQRVGRRSFARGTLRRTGRAGLNRVAFSGRVARRTLRPGRYVMVARARDAGRTSVPRRVTFRIMPAGR